MNLKINGKSVKLGQKYKIVWKGIYGKEHSYIGYLTKVSEEFGLEFIFNHDLYLSPKEIVTINRTNKNETFLEGYTKDDLITKNKESWWDSIIHH